MKQGREQGKKKMKYKKAKSHICHIREAHDDYFIS